MDPPRPPPPPIAVDIPSSDEDDSISGAAFDTPLPPRPKKRLDPCTGGGGRGGEGPTSPQVVVITDDPTPQKQPGSTRFSTPSFVAETPLSPPSSAAALYPSGSIVRCTFAGGERFTRITGLICLESDNESEGGSYKQSTKQSGNLVAESNSSFDGKARLVPSRSDNVGLCSPTNQAASDCTEKNSVGRAGNADQGYSYTGTSGIVQIVGDSPPHGTSGIVQVVEDSPPHREFLTEDIIELQSYDQGECSMVEKENNATKQKGKRAAVVSDNEILKHERVARKKQLKEEKARISEERRRKRVQEKLHKESLKAEVAAMKKVEKEKQKWEKGKFAMKSIVAEIDSKVVESGSVGGHLLTRFAEKGLSFRITSNPVGRSILWKMVVPEQIVQVSSTGSEVPYILLINEAEEFCDLVNSENLINHVLRVRTQYPTFTICYLTNKLMSYINKCEQRQYKNISNGSCWRRPPVEEALAKLTTHFTKVHSRQCRDEAELAEHIVGLTSSLASCQFRKRLTWLSINSNGSIVPKDFIDKNLIKKNVWLKALVAIPKVQPRFAMAIWKKYPTMRSLLNVYMDPNKSVHEKEFLLKNLKIEGLLGSEDRRLGEVCSKRVYRILMAQSGSIKTDDVEDGADFFAN